MKYVYGYYIERNCLTICFLKFDESTYILYLSLCLEWEVWYSENMKFDLQIIIKFITTKHLFWFLFADFLGGVFPPGQECRKPHLVTGPPQLLEEICLPAQTSIFLNKM